mgnify:CR=1 FL=1
MLYLNSVKLDNWKRSVNTKKYIEALENSRSLKSREWIISRNGGDILEQGTWIHEKLILSLARYISVDFEIWIDEQISTLLREGEVKITKQDSYIIENPVERAKRWIEEYQEKLALENKIGRAHV